MAHNSATSPTHPPHSPSVDPFCVHHNDEQGELKAMMAHHCGDALPLQPVSHAITSASTATNSTAARLSEFVSEDHDLTQIHTESPRLDECHSDIGSLSNAPACESTVLQSPSSSAAHTIAMSSFDSLPGYGQFQSSPCYLHLDIDQDPDDIGEHFNRHTFFGDGVDFGAPVEGFVGSRKTKERPGAFMARVAKRSQFYKTRLCPWLEANQCARRDKCNYAHSAEELRTAPDLSCTRICPAVLDGAMCRSSECRFAHSLDELRATNAFYKTRMCRDWYAGQCRAGQECRMAHGEEELRHNPAFAAPQEKCQSLGALRNMRKRCTTWNTQSTRKSTREHSLRLDKAANRSAKAATASGCSDSSEKKLKHQTPNYPTDIDCSGRSASPESSELHKPIEFRRSVRASSSADCHRSDELSVHWCDDVQSNSSHILDWTNARSLGDVSTSSSINFPWNDKNRAVAARSMPFMPSSTETTAQHCGQQHIGLQWNICESLGVSNAYNHSRTTSFECLRQFCKPCSCAQQQCEADGQLLPIAIERFSQACMSKEALHACDRPAELLSSTITHPPTPIAPTTDPTIPPTTAPTIPPTTAPTIPQTTTPPSNLPLSSSDETSGTILSWLPKVPARQLLAALPTFYEE